MHVGVGVGCVCASRLCGARATEQNGLGHNYDNAALAGVCVSVLARAASRVDFYDTQQINLAWV